MSELAGKVAIVTGGASGLGRAMVERFVAAGARVVVADVDPEGGAAVADALGDAAAFQAVDVADAEQIQAAVDLAVGRFGGLDVMCNNAGVGGSMRPFLRDDFRDFERTMAVNVLGVMVGIQRAARHMVGHGGGSIVNTTSIGGINAGPGVTAYRASKAAVIHLTRSLAVELAAEGIRVNCIAPAHIPTAINAAFDQPAIVRAMQPLQRQGTPEDVAEAALFLASDRAAQITGVVLPVDGGTTAGPKPRPMSELLGEVPMAAELVIRGGTVHDGTGAPGRVADVAVAGGVVTEIGPNLSGDRELDASGAVVSPGFIDIHTHYDAQVFWDPSLRPSSYHGVTTVVAGNCGFSIAPTRPEHRETIVRTLENVEDMDAATLLAGVVWDFETFPEYLAAVGARGTDLNFTAYIGHSALRLFVMGDAAYERAATEDEIAAMAGAVREGIAAGAAGFSTSFSFAHRGVDGKPVPSRFADAAEVEALFLAAGEAGKGVVLITPGEQCTYADVYDWQPRVGRPFTYPLFASPGGKHLAPVALHDQGLAHGASVWPQVTPRPLTMQFTMADAYNLNTGAVFGELLKVSRAVRMAAYRDPEWRALAAADLEQSKMRPRWDTYEVSESARYPELQGRRVSDLARERGVSPLDVMCELALTEDLETRFRAYIANDEPDAVGRLLNHEHVALGLSDAGAHVDQLCDAPLPTDLLGTWVRDRGVVPLEHALRKLTGEPADMFGFGGRGYLREGAWADVCVFEPDTVGTGPLRRVRDFPADGERLTAEEPTGVRHVLVNGTPIRVDGEQLDVSGRRPGAHPDIDA